MDLLDKRTQVFSAFRSWEFDEAVFLLFDAATYDLIWARELSRDETIGIGRRVEHTNSSSVAVRDVLRVGVDVTELMQDAYDRIDEPASGSTAGSTFDAR
ncbi:hypothetical protein [Curtobacterium sp. RRHDQ10]|uniref:hypothetical protein n=1 Tax=Curtobacterium phyllosphaerae TaxID=3413379 RepID=UPI003BF32E0C